MRVWHALRRPCHFLHLCLDDFVEYHPPVLERICIRISSGSELTRLRAEVSSPWAFFPTTLPKMGAPLVHEEHVTRSRAEEMERRLVSIEAKLEALLIISSKLDDVLAMSRLIINRRLRV